MKTVQRYIELNPDVGEDYADFLSYCEEIQQQLPSDSEPGYHARLAELRLKLDPRNPKNYTAGALPLRLANSIVLDMLGLGWRIEIKDKKVFAVSPTDGGGGAAEIKEVVRNSHLVERDAQLQQESVKEFIRKMETRRLTDTGWHSIFSVMRDGRELAEKLEILSTVDLDEEKLKLTEKVIQPYLHFVHDEPICRYTGLNLMDVWRYFRHTWINAYRPLPGRSMLILVRDAAAPNHPIIGIAALGSSIVRQKIRDEWIGWDEEYFLKKLVQNPSSKYAKWLVKYLDKLISEIYAEDLIAEKILNAIDLDYPTDLVIHKLITEAERAIKGHREFPKNAIVNINAINNGTDNATWERQSKTKLFRSKRCSSLASLLRIRSTFQLHDFNDGNLEGLEKVLQNEHGRQVVKSLVRKIRAEHVGIHMLDIIVCGAVAPYGSVLGGKLVSMLMCSPEITRMYAKKYEKAQSIIASSMKGKAVIREPKLVLLNTTSLYGTNSSQYNRIKIPCDILGGDENKYIEFKDIGKSEGYGTYHFSETTIEIMERLLGQTHKGRTVNSIFGEGVNPRMRKIGQGLKLIGLTQEHFLLHGNSRIVFVIKLAENFDEFLLGLKDKPSYLFSLKKTKSGTKAIAQHWYKRWLIKRINNQSVIEEVRKHTLSYPITHGARVKIPVVDNNLSLF